MKPSSITASAASSRSPRRLEPVEPPRHDRAQARRHRDLAGGVHRRRQLLGEERVARRRALDGAEGGGRERAGGGTPRDRGDRGAVERAERDFHRGAPLEQTRAHARGRLRKRLVAHAGDHEQALAGGAAGDVAHQRRGGLVRGVQVVDHEHRAALAGRLCEQVSDRREDAVTVHGLLGCARRAAHRGQQPREGGLRAVGERADQLRAPLGERVERLDHRRVRRVALLLVSGAAQGVEAERLRLAEHGLDEAGLADPERARDEQRAAVGGRRAPERAERRGELPLAPFDRSVEEPGRPDRRPARELALERQRLRGGLRADPRELVAQEAELARGGRPVAARDVLAHACAVGLLVGGILAQHVLPAGLGAQRREAALAQLRAGRDRPLRVELVGQQLAAVGGVVAALEALDVGGHLGGRGELYDATAKGDRAAIPERASHVACRLVEVRRGGIGAETRPQRLQHLGRAQAGARGRGRAA